MRSTTTGVLSGRQLYKVSGISFIILGLLLLSASVGYLVFSKVSEARLSEETTSIPLELPDFPNTFQRIDPDALKEAASASGSGTSNNPGVIPDPNQYQPVDWARLPRTVGALPKTERIVIPSIGVDSSIVELNTVWEDGKLVWERPVNAVGHHNGTPNPGEAGNIVMSGHRSSPIRGEGAVFRRLGEVPDILKGSSANADQVDILLYAQDTIYVYRTVSTRVVEPGQVDVFRQTNEPTLTLITCTPDLVYSHRLIATALLIATVPL